MKNILYKFLVTFLLIFSYVFVSASEVNPYYEEFLKLSDSVKKEVSFVPSEYINYYEIENNSSKNIGLRLYGNSLSSYDLRDVNGQRLIPDVKNQNPLSLCWAFAINNMIESYFIKNGKEYNLSENHLDYVSRYYNDTAVFGQANSYYNAIKYLFQGYGPFSEDVFGSYFTSYKNLNYDTYLDYDNTLFDINKLVVLPALKSKYIKENYKPDEIKTNFEKYNQIIKNHLMNYGAIASGIYWDFYDEEDNLVYNDGSLTYAEYYESGHAITIIGWDDNYGTVNINGNTFTGSWLAMNSWGNQIQYFYISYYDENVVQSLLGIKNITEKNWENVYLDKTEIESSTKKTVYEFKKNDALEIIDSVKIFHYDNDDVFTVKISDGYNTYTSSSDRNITYGINTFKFDNVSFDSDKVYVIVESSKGYMSFDVALYTSNDINDSFINIIEDISSMYDNTMQYSVISKGINTGSVYDIKIYDQSNKNISSLFSIEKSMVINDVAKLKIIKVGNIDYSDFIKIVVSSGSYSDSLVLYRTPNGTKDDPFIIRTGYEMVYLSNDYYFELGNDIDMKYETTNLFGDFYNNGNGWKSIEFNGYIDGKGFKISNLTSKNGALFQSANNSEIKNIQFYKFNITDTQNTDSYSALISKTINNNTKLSNIFINESNINCTNTKCGVIVGNMLDGNVNNIHIDKTNLTSSLSYGIISNVENPTNAVTITNVFVKDSKLNNNQENLIGQININATQINLKVISISNNIINGNDTSKKVISGINVNVIDNKSYDIYKEKLLLNDNYIKTNSEILIEDVFNKFDRSIWLFDNYNSLYLNAFEDDYLVDELNRIIKLKNYLIDGNVISKVTANTSVTNFLNNVLNVDELNIKFYSSQDKELLKTDLIATGSYIDILLGDSTQRYYISVPGDINSDGKLSIFDIVKINNHIVYSDKKLTGVYNLAADYNEDNSISIFDIVKINNKILGGN